MYVYIFPYMYLCKKYICKSKKNTLSQVQYFLFLFIAITYNESFRRAGACIKHLTESVFILCSLICSYVLFNYVMNEWSC